MGFHLCYHVMDALHHLLKSETGLRCIKAVMFAIFHMMDNFGAFNEGLARNTTVVETISSHFMGFHQGYFSLNSSSDIRAYEPCCSSADNDQIPVKTFRPLPGCVHLFLF